ncbi:probable LRR receptor-like serine/threonine-protein kinase At3g47570 [Corylus avellana]|uniref:probable LRR receptor-like serine/threonine-protein kinase At3g47570 n=1 Tax=Corylus avellana TaxID=13451 RepID=UPI00286AFBEB|nr:probable LRR receptor-like serine/threonine-protein kinase At3g47570 [Corylus avellana]
MEANDQILNSHTQAIDKMETQLGQMANTLNRMEEGELPNQPVANPRGQYIEEGSTSNLKQVQAMNCQLYCPTLSDYHFLPKTPLRNWKFEGSEKVGFIKKSIIRLNIMIDVASVLEYLHYGSSTTIAHCDLKPSNVLLDEDMVTHVADFGIAKLFGDEDSMMRTVTLATIGYMAPGDVSNSMDWKESFLLARSDVYSYGILLMETFTRKKPINDMFDGETSLKR